MGRAKATLPFGGLTLIERIVAELRRATENIVVVAAPEAEANPLPSLAPITIVRDRVAYQGPVAGLALGLHAVRHEMAFACSCDLPMLRAEVASWTVSLLDGSHHAVIPRIGAKLQPLHAAYSRQCAAAFEAMIERGEHRVTAIADAADVRIISEEEYRRVDPDALSCLNINTSEDYARALKLAGVSEPAD
jgi:molybdenum cofactor guanylyltransferase